MSPIMRQRQAVTILVPALVLLLILSGCARSPLTGERLYALLDSHIEKMRRHTYIASHPDLSKDIREAILNGKILTGMTKSQVIASWGDTYRKNKYDSGTREQWVYPHFYLHFTNGTLSSWDETYHLTF